MEDFKNYPLVLFGVTAAGLLLWFLYDVVREIFRWEPPVPPEDLRKVWVEVDPDRFLKNYIHSKTTNYGTAVKTHVYMYKESREVSAMYSLTVSLCYELKELANANTTKNIM